MQNKDESTKAPLVVGQEPIVALVPRDDSGAQFVCYGDCCSGRPGTRLERNFAMVNAVLRRLNPPPTWICFVGDEIMGLTEDYEALRAQWEYWRNTEMAWLRELSTHPALYSVPSNHTTYDAKSEEVWKETHTEVPSNGPTAQRGLAYAVRRGEVLLVCVDTSHSGLGGNGHVECSWLDQILEEHSDASYKFVIGHYPAYALNGYTQYPDWRIVPADVKSFWDVLVRHNVIAYVCSHVIAFDVQVHSGVLQITTGGAGTNHGPNGFMRGPMEYLHLVQLSVDRKGVRFQVLDDRGDRREAVSWPPSSLPPSQNWQEFAGHGGRPEVLGSSPDQGRPHLMAWRLMSEKLGPGGEDQALVCGTVDDEGPPTIWIGLSGSPARVTVRILVEPGGCVQEWRGDALFHPSVPFDVELAIHSGMGPGGVMMRTHGEDAWSSLESSSARGAELMKWPDRWVLGHGRGGIADEPFRGVGLRATWYRTDLAFP